MRAQATVSISLAGVLPDPDFSREIRRAQEENARLWERTVRDMARRDMETSKTHPGRTRHSRMADRYYGRVDAQNNLSGDNPTEQAKWKEFGTGRHPIAARPGSSRGARGRFIRGARALRFPNPGVAGGIQFAKRVNHPGQPPRPVMLEAMERNMGRFEENLRNAVARAISRRR